MNHVTVLYAGVVLAILAAFVGVVVVPQAQLGRPADAASASPSGDIARGRDTYIRLGCLSCHTQQVRAADVEHGVPERPSTPDDYADDGAPLLGTLRTGPDLTDVGARQPSSSWHYRHLYYPERVSPDSMMPPFAFLFEPAAPRATHADAILIDDVLQQPSERAADLVAYLLSLKQQGASTSIDDASMDPIELGRRVYAACRNCHQADGRGLEGLYPPLVGSEWLLGDAESAVRLVLHGLHDKTGTAVTYPEAMPAWDYWSDAHLAAVLTFARSAWGNAASAVAPETVKAMRDETPQRHRAWTRAELTALRAPQK